MKNQNSKIFPKDHSDDEILKTIEQNAEGLRKNLMHRSGIIDSTFYSSAIEMGYYELNKRNQEKFIKQVEKLNQENEKSGKISFRLNIITIILAILSIILSLVTLFHKDNSELQELKKINGILTEQNK